MQLLVDFFSWLMEWCHSWCPSYWADIVIFTFITKVIQFPLSLWCQANALKMVSLMPESNRIKMNHYGDKDAIGDKTAALFRRERYHPLLSLVPLAVQIVILMCFVKVIYGIGDRLAAPGAEKPLIACIPVSDGGLAWLMPILAGAAAWLLGFSQNVFNPLQHEQTRTQQIVTNGISICISLFLGMFVATGVGLYWAASNVFSILVQFGENVCLPPRKYVDYPALRRSQVELMRFEAALKASAKAVSREDRRREKADYKRFFSVANKHLVFYAEGGGFYKYFKPVIEWLLAHSNVTIHYVTNDPKDPILVLPPSRRQVKAHGGLVTTPAAGTAAVREDAILNLQPDEFAKRIRPYYIGQTRIIPLMMKMDADMVVMTTPDLGTYQIKRSYVKKDVEYVYMDHGTSSMSMAFRKGAFDHFDTIFLNGRFLEPEFRKTEELYGTKRKTLVPTGYAYLGDLIARYRPPERKPFKQILIAPSHQAGNILESCLGEMLDSLAKVPDVRIVLRPHPQFVRRFPVRWQAIRAKAAARSGVVIDDDFSKSAALYESDVLITDWSSIAYEYSLVTKRPSVQVNTPMKVVNPEYGRIGIEPTDITFRDRIGKAIDVADVPSLGAVVTEMIAHPETFAAKIADLLATEFYDPLKAGEIAGRYILDSLIAKGDKRK